MKTLKQTFKEKFAEYTILDDISTTDHLVAYKEDNTKHHVDFIVAHGSFTATHCEVVDESPDQKYGNKELIDFGKEKFSTGGYYREGLEENGLVIKKPLAWTVSGDTELAAQYTAIYEDYKKKGIDVVLNKAIYDDPFSKAGREAQLVVVSLRLLSIHDPSYLVGLSYNDVYQTLEGLKELLKNYTGTVESMREQIFKLAIIFSSYSQLTDKVVEKETKEVKELLGLMQGERGNIHEAIEAVKEFAREKGNARTIALGEISEVFSGRVKQISLNKWITWGAISSFVAITFLFFVTFIKSMSVLGLYIEVSHDPYTIPGKIAIFTTVATISAFCFRQYIYERKIKEAYELKQRSLDAMGLLLSIPAVTDKVKIIEYALPNIFSESAINSEKKTQPFDNNIIIEMLRLAKSGTKE